MMLGRWFFFVCVLVISIGGVAPICAEEAKAEHEAPKAESEAPKEGEHKEGEKKDAKKDDKDLPENRTSVKLAVSVSRFDGDRVSSLISYLFYFKVISYDMREKIYNDLKWFQGSIVPQLTSYISNPAHDPKDQREIKQFLLKLTNKILNERYGEKDDKGNPKKDEKGKPILRKYVTTVYINKVFERKL